MKSYPEDSLSFEKGAKLIDVIKTLQECGCTEITKIIIKEFAVEIMFKYEPMLIIPEEVEV